MISSTLAMAGTSRTIGHLYDREGNRTRITHPDGGWLAYEYDGLERLRLLREDNGDPLVAIAFDAAGRRSGLTSGGTASAYTYDPAGRLAGLNHNLAGPSADQVIGLGYNPAGQIVQRTGTNFGYAWTGSVAVNRPYSVNGQNQYIAAGPASFAYDPNGNLTVDGSSTFVYDVENRLVSASGAKTAALVYDPLGRLFQTSGGAAGITQLLYDDDALIGEYNSAGTMTRRYVHGAEKGVDDPLLWYENLAGGWRRALVADQQGSIIAVADMSGNPIAINAYDEYGIPGAGNVGRFQYTGQAWIPELGMYYYKARIYSPTLGRFLQTDPIGYDDQVNLYAYVGNDPINGLDPTGECTIGVDKDGKPMNMGLCGTDAKSQEYLEGRMQDQNSAIASTDANATSKGRLMNFTLGPKNAWGNQVDGGEARREVDGVINIAVDEADTILVRGVDVVSGERVEDYVMSLDEKVEHEVGHGNNYLNNEKGLQGAIKAENALRAKRGDTFRRVGHDGKIIRGN